MVEMIDKQRFNQALKSCDIGQLAKLVQEIPGLLHAPKPGNWLHVATPRARVEAIEWLIAQGLDVNLPDDRETPLCKALVHERLDVARALLEHGADPNCHMSTITPVNGGKKYPLEAIKLLDEFGVDLNRQYVNERLGYPMNALSMAKDSQLSDVVEYLESRGCTMPEPEGT